MSKEKREEILAKKDKVVSLRRNHICRNNDYTVCEYDLNSGELRLIDGGLLAHCGVSLPETLFAFRKHVQNWPVDSVHLDHLIRHVEMSIADSTDEGKAFSDVEMLLDNEDISCWISISSVKLYRDTGASIVLVFVCANDKKYQLMRLIGKAETDSLTGAVNRITLQNTVEKMAADGGRHAFVMLDIDGFKKFNDTFGHIVGDDMLVNIVHKLKNGLRREDVIGRIGGDEFMICLGNIADMAMLEGIADQICVLTRHSMENGMYVSASLGIALSPRDGTTFEELYRKADIAMYRSKHHGGDKYTVFSPEMDQEDNDGTGAKGNGLRGVKVIDGSVLIHYNIADKEYIYPDIVRELFCADFDDRPLWQIICEDGIAPEETADKFRKAITELMESEKSEVRFEDAFLRTIDGIWRWYRVGFTYWQEVGCIAITITDIHDEVVSNRRLRHIVEYDELTGLLTGRAFNRMVESIVCNDPEGVAAGEYALVYFDILRFKAINDMFGTDQGDRLLLYIADIIASGAADGGAAGRIGSDRFMMLAHKSRDELQNFLDEYFDSIGHYEVAYEIVSNVGIYIIEDASLPADAMLDRAILAQSSIKGSYAVKYCYYTEALRHEMISEQEIVGLMTTALAERQFQVYYQPQYNHSTGKIVGAEALVRWCHPERGLIMPGSFVPLFEKNGFISKVDLYVFEQVCAFLQKCINSGISVVPISVNIARYDIFQFNFIERLEAIRTRYDVPVELLRIEITESTVVGSNQHVADVIDKLHSFGYIIEMDDFGSGYSSLNVLKDINLDVLKLDIQFLSGDIGIHKRGGTILSAIIRMARWLNLPVIAEGVENIHQADYMRSIGCNYVQGYLYAKPMQQNEFEELIKGGRIGAMISHVELIETLDACDFWDPESLETIIFSNYVGGAAIFDYRGGNIEVLRVNKKYIQELGNNVTEQFVLNNDALGVFDEENKRIYLDMLERAIASMDEEECETWRVYSGLGGNRICLRSSVRVIGKSRDSYLFYAMIRNITSER